VLDTTTPGGHNLVFINLFSRKFIIKYALHNDQVVNGEHYLVRYKCTVLWAVLYHLLLYRITIVAGVVVICGTILMYSRNLDTLSISSCSD